VARSPHESPDPVARSAPGTSGSAPPSSWGVAAFDLDGTLTLGDSSWRFLVFACGWKATVRAGLGASLQILLGTIVGGSSADRAKAALFSRLFAGMSEADLSERGKQFGDHMISRRSRRELMERFSEHLASGHAVVVISASLDHYVRPIAERLGARGVLATELEADPDGVLTGRILGTNCRAAEKARRLQAWIAEHQPAGARPEIWAYGNSMGDRELLSMADHPVNVGRMRHLGRLARHHSPSRLP